MSNTYQAPLGAPIWLDLTTSDPERAQEFYSAVLGWTFEAAGPDYGGYINAKLDGQYVAGMMQNDPQWGTPDCWSTHLHTNDIQATAAKATAAGATVWLEPMEVPDKGWMAAGTDPAGAGFGLWQPGGHAGFEVVGRAGAPVWHQLTTREFGKALEFYTAVFGWEPKVEGDTDEFRYSTVAFGDAASDGECVATLGVMDGSLCLPPEVPSSWNFFAGADDVDKTLRVIVEHGGSVVRDAEDTPYGRLASAADPMGAVFNLSSVER